MEYNFVLLLLVAVYEMFVKDIFKIELGSHTYLNVLRENCVFEQVHALFFDRISIFKRYCLKIV
jgi:hypothetical protein